MSPMSVAATRTRPTYIIRHQGEPAIMLAAVMQQGWNGLELGKALEARQARSPRGCRSA
jgi:multidrug efflux pump subunit AcrB